MTATISKNKIRPILPRDISNITREGRTDEQLEAGTLVVREDNKLVPVDTTNPLHTYAPVEVVWTDGTLRQDIKRIELDGTEVIEVTTFAFDFIAEVDVSLFTNTPDEGDFVMRSATAGKMTCGDLVALDGDFNLVVGQVVSAGTSTGKWVVKFRLS